MTSNRQAAAIAQRLRTVYGRFTVDTVDDSGVDSGGRADVQRVDGTAFSSEGLLERAAHVQGYGMAVHPIPGAMGIYIELGGSRGRLAVLNCDDPRHRPKDLVEGEVALYTDEHVAIHLKRGEEIEIRADLLDQVIAGDASITTTGAGDLTLEATGTGDLSIDAAGGTTTIDGDTKVSVPSSDVELGASGGTMGFFGEATVTQRGLQTSISDALRIAALEQALFDLGLCWKQN